MNPEKQERIRQTLRSLVAAQATTIKLVEQMLELMGEELSLDPVTFWKSRALPTSELTLQALDFRELYRWHHFNCRFLKAI